MPTPCGNPKCRACNGMIARGVFDEGFTVARTGWQSDRSAGEVMAPIAIPAADLLNVPSREFILLAGKDGVGKTCAIISLADFVSQVEPSATFYVLDLENKYRAALQTFGSVPSNVVLYQVDTMNDVTEAFDEIMNKRAPGDWLAVESAGRLWERAQDMGYQVITGTTKALYMERRRATPANQKQPPVTPRPDDLWSIIKGAHDSAFLDVIAQANDLNCIISTGVSRTKEARSNRKENPDRIDWRNETGIDLNLEGAPRLPYFIYTGILLEMVGGLRTARVWRDNLSKLDDPAVTFTIPTRRDFATQFYVETGRA